MIFELRAVAVSTALVGLAAPALADPAALATAAALRDAAMASDLAYEITEELTTQIGPRLAGTPGEARARDWAVAELTALGFQNVRIEPFPMNVWMRGPERVEITGASAQPLVATALGRSAPTPEGGIEAEIVRFATFDDLLAAPEGSLTGKIAFVDEAPLVRARDGSGYGPANRKRTQGPSEASKRGAAALLIRSVGSSTGRFAHTGVTRYDEGVRPIPAAAVSNADAHQLSRLLDAGAPVRVAMSLATKDLGEGMSGNVIAEIPGREVPEEIVILSAHLDSWDLSPGAQDDASGVGIVTAAAKFIADLPTPPRRTIRIIHFGAEEVGLIGGRAYTARLSAGEIANHAAAFESDFGSGAIYRFQTRIGEEDFPAADVIQSALAPLGIERSDNTAGGGPDLTFLRQAGVPMMDLDHDGYRYFDIHHTPNDTIDTVDPDQIRQAAAAYAVAAYLAAELDVDWRGMASE